MIMLAFLIAVPIVPILIILGVVASKWQLLSKAASAVLKSLPNVMLLWYFSIDETVNCLVYGKGKVISTLIPINVSNK